ncbi:MAG: hypothetical protein IJ849_01995 [Selenomonadaceae bacterium]|nr:hypothetical protein [Selenomonadaceae bacterium]
MDFEDLEHLVGFILGLYRLYKAVRQEWGKKKRSKGKGKPAKHKPKPKKRSRK